MEMPIKNPRVKSKADWLLKSCASKRASPNAPPTMRNTNPSMAHGMPRPMYSRDVVNLLLITIGSLQIGPVNNNSNRAIMQTKSLHKRIGKAQSQGLFQLPPGGDIAVIQEFKIQINIHEFGHFGADDSIPLHIRLIKRFEIIE